MQGQVLARKLKKLPDCPGTYFFLGNRKQILYIGRATSLRTRVRSYFAPDIAEKRSSWIAKMLPRIADIDYRETDSVLEAVLLEADLIKKFKPPYNTDLKDDKSFNCVVITREDFPAVLVARSRDIDLSSLTVNCQRLTVRRQKLLAAYGPFPNGFELQTAMKIIRRIFPYRDAKCTPPAEQTRPHQQHTGKLEFVGMCRPCFSRQIWLCPGVCTGAISRREYAKTIRNLRLFFEGKKGRLLKLLERGMKTAARQQKFEKAGELKRQMFALKHIQDIALLRRSVADERRYEDADTRRYESPSASINVPISEHQRLRVEAYDLSHFGGKGIVGAMAVVEDGVAKPSEYRLFKIRGITNQNEVAGLQEIIRRRLKHPEWRFPNLIVVDGNKIQKRAAESVLAEFGQNIPAVAVVKDERHRPREIIGLQVYSEVLKNIRISWKDAERAIFLANAEAHRFALTFQKKQRK